VTFTGIIHPELSLQRVSKESFNPFTIKLTGYIPGTREGSAAIVTTEGNSRKCFEINPHGIYHDDHESCQFTGDRLAGKKNEQLNHYARYSS
jgi:hypothetical protein